MKFKLLSLVVLLLYPLAHFSQTLHGNIQKAYSLLEADPQLKYAISSLTIVDANTGKEVFSRNASFGLSPASTLKTITSATAYHLLGEDFKWETSLSYTGSLNDDGVLNGNIIIKGAGDPTLGSSRYDQSKAEVTLAMWIEAIKRAGIKRIEGQIVADDSFFGTQTIPYGWIWQDMGNYYGAGSSAVCWNENQFTISIKPGAFPGAPVSVTATEPEIPYLTIINEITTGVPGTGDRVYAYSAPYSDIIYLRGTYAIDLTKRVSASFPDPAYEAAFRLAKSLEQAGVGVGSGASTQRRLAAKNQTLENGLITISAYSSPSLADITHWFNRKSINLYGENMLKTFAFKVKGKATTEDGTEVLRNFWSQKISIDKSSMAVIDGSGLSPENKITTAAMVMILQSVRSEPWFKSYFNSFPEYNGMKMKSGTLRNVLAYAGYHQNRKGQNFVFSFIVNNYRGSSNAMRQKMFKVLDQLK